MAVLVTKWFGAFVVEQGRVTAERRFPLVAAEVARRLRAIRNGDVLDEERALATAGVDVGEARLRPLGTYVEGTGFVEAPVEEPDRRVLHEAALIAGRDESRRAAGEADRFIAHAVRGLEDLDTTINTLTERLREWYGLHYPESLTAIPDPAKFVRLVAKDSRREALAAEGVAVRPDDSIGDPLDEAALASLRSFAEALERLVAERARLERTVADRTRTVAPNLSRLVGEVIAAKLIARAGSLERLAFSPASTVQTLGAETALFAHLKENAKPPKHGVLFQHGLVNTAPKWQRGKMARRVAASALIAARIDHFAQATSPRDGLKERLDAQAAQVKKLKRPSPKPPRHARPHQHPRGPPVRGRGRR